MNMGCARLVNRCLFAMVVFFILPQMSNAHVFNLYSGTSEEIKELVDIHCRPEGRVTIEYKGEYHGQLAAHIRFMMDADQNNNISSREEQRFMQDYQTAWNRMAEQYKAVVDGTPYKMVFTRSQFPELQNADLRDPLPVNMQFNNRRPPGGDLKDPKSHQLEVSQRLLFLVGQVFIEMSKERAAFTLEQENAIARFCQVRVVASENMTFTSCFPGYINRKKRYVIEGIFFDDTSMRIQFFPYPRITVTYTTDS